VRRIHDSKAKYPGGLTCCHWGAVATQLDETQVQLTLQPTTLAALPVPYWGTSCVNFKNQSIAVWGGWKYASNAIAANTDVLLYSIGMTCFVTSHAL
jgi:hypothetical protein